MSNLEHSSEEWFFVRWMRELTAGFKWLSPGALPTPDSNDATGELRRLVLSRKGWFDAIASSWSEQPWWVHALSAVTLIFGAPLIATVLQLPALSLLFVIILSVALHVGLVSHEYNRRYNAEASIEDSLNLTILLEKKEEIIDELKVQLEAVNVDLHEQVEIIKTQAQEFHEISVRLDAERAKASDTLNLVNQVSEERIAIEKQSIADSKSVSHGLSQLEQTIEQTCAQQQEFRAKADEFSDVISSMVEHHKQQKVSDSEFTLFVKNLASSKSVAIQEPIVSIIRDEEYQAKRAQVKDFLETFEEEMKSLHILCN